MTIDSLKKIFITETCQKHFETFSKEGKWNCKAVFHLSMGLVEAIPIVGHVTSLFENIFQYISSFFSYSNRKKNIKNANLSQNKSSITIKNSGNHNELQFICNKNTNITTSNKSITSNYSEKVNINKQSEKLFKLIFEESINSKNFNSIRNLGNKIETINLKLNEFNQENKTKLKCIGSYHTKCDSDPWQTIKIIDESISTPGKESPVLKNFHEILTNKHGIVTNGGDRGPNSINKNTPKRVPACFKKFNGIIIHPQIQISKIDVEKILFDKNSDDYVKALKSAY